MKFGFFLVTILGLNVGVNSIPYDNVSALVDSLLNNYDRRLRPNYGGVPTEVQISMYVISVSAISDSNMDFTLEFYFRENWNDPRLVFANLPGLDSFALGHDFGKQIWLPDLFFVGEKSSVFHATTTKNEFIRVDSEGNVKRSIRLSVTAACPMNFQRFPRDSQTCNLDIESYGSNAKGILLRWKENGTSVGVSNHSVLQLFQYVGHKEREELIVLSTATYSRLNVSFEFKRLFGHYLRQIFIPLTMLVIISWLSFWMKENAYQARLIVTSLSLFSQVFICQFTANAEAPQTEYAKAVDIFTGTSLTFSFIAFIVFLFVSNCSEVSAKSRVDRFFQLAFPAAFAIFNVVYWTVC